jgi:hypothetical protein
MPILTEPREKKRKARPWVWGLLALLALSVGLVGWPLVHPVEFTFATETYIVDAFVPTAPWRVPWPQEGSTCACSPLDP